MAEELFQKLEEQLNCSICLDTYIDPKLLQCFHVYCRQCLVPLVDRDHQGQLGLSCPTCRQVTPIPDKGVAGLQPAFHINNLLEIKNSFQKVENPTATLEEAAPSSPVVKETGGCSVHEGKELELYCETCGEFICTRCALRSGSHHDHHYEDIKQAFEKYKAEITLSLEPMEKQVGTLKKTLIQLDERCGEISNQRADIVDDIHVTFRRLQEFLSLRETELIGQLDEITLAKLKGIALQKDQLETILAQRKSCLYFMKESLKTGNEGDVLKMKTNSIKQVKELSTPLQPDILEPNAAADIVFAVSADMPAACRNYGQVFAPGLPDPSKCHLTEFSAEAGEDKKCTVSLQVINFEGKPSMEAFKSLECQLVSETTSVRASCGVERRGQSQYEISYQPTVKGRHQLHIKAEGQHIRGSPFSIAVKSPVEKLGTPILTIGGVNLPWGVAVNKMGEVVVTEWGGHCVSMFSPSGEKLRSFGTRGSAPGQFLCPSGVAVDDDRNVLVVDSKNCRIQKFTHEGQFILSADTRSVDPVDIAYNSSSNKFYMVDTTFHCVHILNSDLTISSTFGRKGSSKGHFIHPGCVACDSTGKVYVADTENHRIQVFTAEGKFLRMFGKRGQSSGELDQPVGIGIDTDDVVYVSEWKNHRISMFTSRGEFVTSFGRRGKEPGEFVSPRGRLAVDNSGVVYVCDRDNYHVQIF